MSAVLSLPEKQTARSPPSASVDVVEYGRRRVLVVIGVMLATVLQVLDATIVNVALPTIQGNLGANLNEGTWIITGYIIAAVIVIPLTPWLQTRFGRKRYYVSAILGFTITSVLCGLANTLRGGGLLSRAARALRRRLAADGASDPARHLPAERDRAQPSPRRAGGDRRSERRTRRSEAFSPTSSRGTGSSTSTSFPVCSPLRS